jgi:radical SAM protein with 4Fe4S-binding SPASM domain
MSAPAMASTAPLRGEPARLYVEGHHPYGWQEMLAFPKYVDLDTINTCNARCTMCGIDFERRVPARMPEALFEKIVAELAARRTEVARVTLVVNSEPLMDRRLAERVARLKKAGVDRTCIITNASLLSPRRAEELLRAGLDTTYISIDSLDPPTYERIRRGLSFDVVYRNACEFIRLKRAINPGGRVRISMVQLRENLAEAEAYVRHWAERLGPNDQVVVTRGYNWGIARDVVRLGSTRAAHNRVPCVGLWTSCVIDVEGQVRLCCADQDGRTQVGDVRRQSIAEIWHGRELSRVRDMHLDGRRHEIEMCDGCPIWSVTKHVLKHEIPAGVPGPLIRKEGNPLLS